MKYDPNLHHRRSIRLKNHDYSTPGAYFITVCTFNRELLLEEAQVRQVILNAWSDLPRRFPSVQLDEFIVMPNHVHGIIFLTGAASSAPTLGKVVRAFKSLSAIEANEALKRRSRLFWQRGYYERVIRNEDELNAVRQYIRDNPLKWDEDPDNPANLTR